MIDYTALASLRPLMPVASLADAVGPTWQPPAAKDEGHVWSTVIPGFGARLDERGRLGRVSFYKDFPQHLVVEGLHIGMTLGEAQGAHPALEADAVGGSPDIQSFSCLALADDELHARFKDGLLLGFDLVHPGLTYPARPAPKTWPDTAKAYDLAMLPRRADRAAADNHGWCFGLPPGLRPEQWPLDPRTGQPMRHAFTLLLPEDHRVKGPALVAVSLFATDWNGDVCDGDPLVAAAWNDPAEPEHSELRPIWLHRTGLHPHEHRMVDILDEPYAVIWLTRAEFDGPLCPPPLPPSGSVLAEVMPAWTRVGAAAAAVFGGDQPKPGLTTENNYLAFQIGCVPPADLAFDCALHWSLRGGDPNAGHTPPDGWSEETAADYQSIWDRTDPKATKLQPWAEQRTPNHIGGSMFPVQAHPSPPFSPFYIEFEEALGGFNFAGDGLAQLDLAQMRLDWACG